jgi:hypothetical protein
MTKKKVAATFLPLQKLVDLSVAIAIRRSDLFKPRSGFNLRERA